MSVFKKEWPISHLLLALLGVLPLLLIPLLREAVWMVVSHAAVAIPAMFCVLWFLVPGFQDAVRKDWAANTSKDSAAPGLYPSHSDTSGDHS